MGAAPLTGLLEEQEIVPVNTPGNLQRAAVSAIFTGLQRASSCKSEDLELGGGSLIYLLHKNKNSLEEARETALKSSRVCVLGGRGLK